jgi:hypothetical protein
MMMVLVVLVVLLSGCTVNLVPINKTEQCPCGRPGDRGGEAGKKEKPVAETEELGGETTLISRHEERLKTTLDNYAIWINCADDPIPCLSAMMCDLALRCEDLGVPFLSLARQAARNAERKRVRMPAD